MNPRTVRRAAERQALKQARKAAEPVSPAKITANQANAQLSAGPITPEGKLASSKNALKTGLTGRTVLLPTDDANAYQALLDKFVADFKPASLDERTLLQSMVDSTWRLERLVTIEFGIYAIGTLEFSDEFEHLEPAARGQMIQVETYLKYEKSLRNLNIQESRLQRHLLKDKAELQRLQTERLQQEANHPAAPSPSAADLAAAPQVGFVFSNDEMLPTTTGTLPYDPSNTSAGEINAPGAIKGASDSCS